MHTRAYTHTRAHTHTHTRYVSPGGSFGYRLRVINQRLTNAGLQLKPEAGQNRGRRRPQTPPGGEVFGLIQADGGASRRRCQRLPQASRSGSDRVGPGPESQPGVKPQTSVVAGSHNGGGSHQHEIGHGSHEKSAGAACGMPQATTPAKPRPSATIGVLWRLAASRGDSGIDHGADASPGPAPGAAVSANPQPPETQHTPCQAQPFSSMSRNSSHFAAKVRFYTRKSPRQHAIIPQSSAITV